MSVIPFDKQSNLFGDEETAVCEDDEQGLNTSQLGRAAEFRVCYELTLLGYYVWHCDAPGFDLILVLDDMSLRVQVKSTTNICAGYCDWTVTKDSPGSHRRKGTRVQRAIDRREADLVALYHHVFGTTVFVSIDEVRGMHIRLPVSQVREHDCSRSLDRALARLILED